MAHILEETQNVSEHTIMCYKSWTSKFLLFILFVWNGPGFVLAHDVCSTRKRHQFLDLAIRDKDTEK